MPLVTPSVPTSASPLSRMLSSMRVKSPFSHSAWFGFTWVASVVICVFPSYFRHACVVRRSRRRDSDRGRQSRRDAAILLDRLHIVKRLLDELTNGSTSAKL